MTRSLGRRVAAIERAMEERGQTGEIRVVIVGDNQDALDVHSTDRVIRVKIIGDPELTRQVPAPLEGEFSAEALTPPEVIEGEPGSVNE